MTKHQSHGTKEVGRSKPRFRRGTIHTNGMWRWQWPANGNRWNTKSKTAKAVASTRFTPTGPSKRTVARRAARHARGRG